MYGRTEEEHDANLLSLFQTASREGLVFNSNKCHIKTNQINQINFFGSLYSDTGIRPDPGRIEDIHSIPTPQDKEDLQKFLGLITYVSVYIPNLADKAAILRDLLKKNVPYLWQDDHQAAFEALKNSITTEACLQYYNPEIHTVLEVDASQKSVGACLLQNNRPIAFASKSLSPAQANYSNIERETLALVSITSQLHESITKFKRQKKTLYILCQGSKLLEIYGLVSHVSNVIRKWFEISQIFRNNNVLNCSYKLMLRTRMIYLCFAQIEVVGWPGEGQDNV